MDVLINLLGRNAFTMCTLKYNLIFQLYLNKAGEKRNRVDACLRYLGQSKEVLHFH